MIYTYGDDIHAKAWWYTIALQWIKKDDSEESSFLVGSFLPFILKLKRTYACLLRRGDHRLRWWVVLHHGVMISPKVKRNLCLRLMIYTYGDDIHAKAWWYTIASQWIKKSKPCDLDFLAESKRFARLCLAFATQTTDYVRLRREEFESLAKVHLNKKIKLPKGSFIFWRRARDSNSRNAFDVYTISNRAPSTDSDNSP